MLLIRSTVAVAVQSATNFVQSSRCRTPQGDDTLYDGSRIRGAVAPRSRPTWTACRSRAVADLTRRPLRCR